MGSLDGQAAMIALRCAIFVAGVSGNGLIIFLILRVKKLRTERFNWLIVLLAFGDILLGMGIAVDYLTTLLTGGVQWRFSCLGVGSVALYGDHVAQLGMLLIAFDRMTVIKKVHIVKTDKNVYATIIPLVLLLSLVPIAFQFWNSNDPIVICQLSLVWTKQFALYMTIASSFFNISILVSYLVIVFYYRRLVRQTSHSSVQANKKHFMKVVLGIVVVYFLMWCVPKWNLVAMRLSGVSPRTLALCGMAVDMCEVLSTCLNVVVYGYTHRDLREAGKSFLKYVRSQNTSTTSVITSQRV
uniref:G_PROTEIN_RECEP_F1_2 domain-containing protein n=1 Tax=Steinernema glaseri TaxID=37863 RepID=A0A1I7Z7Q9_9BILA